CDRVIRRADGTLEWVYAVAQNLANARVRGYDMEVSWQMEPNLFDGQLESFSLRWLGSLLEESSTTPFEGQPQDAAGGLGSPEYTHVLTANYGIGPWSVQLANRFVDSTIMNINWVEGVHVDDNSIPSMTWWNARLAYAGELSNGANWNVGLNIQNLLDRAPPVVPGFGTRGG